MQRYRWWKVCLVSAAWDNRYWRNTAASILKAFNISSQIASVSGLPNTPFTPRLKTDLRVSYNWKLAKITNDFQDLLEDLNDPYVILHKISVYSTSCVYTTVICDHVHIQNQYKMTKSLVSDQIEFQLWSRKFT